MDEALFLVPTIRRLGGNDRVAADPLHGSVPPWVGGLNEQGAEQLLELATGLMRSLQMAGYATPTVRYEHAGTKLDIELPDRLAGGEAVDNADGLAPARSAGFQTFVAVLAEPLPLFGTASKLPLGIDLSLANSADLVHVKRADGTTQWLAFRCPAPEFTASKASLQSALRAACATIADDILAQWDTLPVPGSATRAPLGFLFTRGRWRFPPFEHAIPLPGAGAHVDAAWAAFCDHLADPAARATWLSDELAPADDRKGLFDKHRLAVRFSDVGGDPSALADAYRRRLLEHGQPIHLAHLATADQIGDLATVDALMTMIEHGILEPFQEVPLRATPEVPSEAPTESLTGIWKSVTGPNDVLMIHQAGDYVEGFLYRRVSVHHSTTSHDISGYVFSMDMSSGAGPDEQSFLGDVWDIDDSSGANRNSSMSVNEFKEHVTGVVGTLASDHTGSETNVQISFGTYLAEFTRYGFNTHLTNHLINTTGLPGLVRQLHGPPPAPGQPEPPTNDPTRFQARLDAEREVVRLQSARKRTLHPDEQERAIQIADILANGAEAWERAIDNGGRTTAYVTATNQTIAALGPEYRDVDNTNTRFDEVAYAIGYDAREQLQLESEDGGWHTLQSIVRMVGGDSSSTIANLIGINVEQQSGQQYWYEFKLSNVYSQGAKWIVGGAYGTGDFEFRRVDPVSGAVIGTPSPPYATTLYTFAGSSTPGFEYGMEDTPGWVRFDHPTDHDLLPHIEGSSISFTSPLTVDVSVVSSAAPIDVIFTPSDNSMDLRATLSGKWIDVPLYTGQDINRHKDQLDKWKDLKDGVDDLRKKRIGKGLNRFKPGASAFNTSGTIGSSLFGTAAPLPSFVAQPHEFSVTSAASSMYESASHTVTPEFLRVLRRFLAAYLPVLVGPFVVVEAIGHASRLGSVPSNLSLSERRAVSVIEAIRNVLGSQLGVPASAIHAVGVGESEAGGDDDDDRPADRRSDLSINGFVTLRL